MKRFAALTILLVVLFTAMSLYRTHVIDPQLDEVYAHIYGLDEEDDE